MKTLISSRLEELQSEYKKGQERLTTLEQETHNVRNSMLRISGAIQVLEELMKSEESVMKKEEVEMENGALSNHS